MSCHKKLQIKGYKLTPQRVEIINILHKTNEHISAAEIYKRLKIKFPFTDISTIYRTLELLKNRACDDIKFSRWYNSLSY